MSRQGRPVGLIIAAVAVTAAALLLWMIVRSGDDGASANPQQQQQQQWQPQARQPAGGDPAAGRSGDGAPGGAAGGAPAAASKDGEERPGIPRVADSDQPRRDGLREDRPTETIINGVRVRDHRKDRSQPIVLPDRPPPTSRRIAPELTGAISNRILPIVRECAAGVPPEARGAKPRAEGQVVISIKEHQVSIRQATFDLTDVVGAASEPTKQCIQQKALAVTVPAGDEGDLENYPIHLSYGL